MIYLEWTAVSGQIYQLEYCTVFTPSLWTTLIGPL
jgi:hypothetical protein